MIQINDATQAVKQIGLQPAVTIMLLLAGGIAAVFLFKYFSSRLDKKDTQILQITEDRREDLGKMVDSQRLLVDTQKDIGRGQEKIVEALEALVDGIRQPRKR